MHAETELNGNQISIHKHVPFLQAMEAWVWSQVTPCDTFGEQSSTETGFISSTFVSPSLSFHQFCILIHWCCIILATGSIKVSGLVWCGTTVGWVVPVVSKIVVLLSALQSLTRCTGHVATWLHIPEHLTLQQHHWENLKYCNWRCH